MMKIKNTKLPMKNNKTAKAHSAAVPGMAGRRRGSSVNRIVEKLKNAKNTKIRAIQA
jgi:hypothetical protein